MHVVVVVMRGCEDVESNVLIVGVVPEQLVLLHVCHCRHLVAHNFCACMVLWWKLV